MKLVDVTAEWERRLQHAAVTEITRLRERIAELEAELEQSEADNYQLHAIANHDLNDTE